MHRLAIGDLEAREVCDNLMTTCHASPESNDDGDGIGNGKSRLLYIMLAFFRAF